jgi:2'-5' RNA ligase
VQRALGDVARHARRECGGRAVPDRNIHLTLVFLGDLPREHVTALETLAASIAAPRFTLDVDRLEYWRHNRIVWAGVDRCPQALQTLVERLHESLAAAGYRFDRRSYAPHLTLLRDARRAPADGRLSAVSWPVTEFTLMESVQRERGRVYEPLRNWRLTG